MVVEGGGVKDSDGGGDDGETIEKCCGGGGKDGDDRAKIMHMHPCGSSSKLGINTIFCIFHLRSLFSQNSQPNAFSSIFRICEIKTIFQKANEGVLNSTESIQQKN